MLMYTKHFRNTTTTTIKEQLFFQNLLSYLLFQEMTSNNITYVFKSMSHQYNTQIFEVAFEVILYLGTIFIHFIFWCDYS